MFKSYKILYFFLIFTAYFLSASLNTTSLAYGSHNFATESHLKTALVIGNGKYESSPLKNPVNDALDMASMLRQCGFEVAVKLDISKREMENAIRQFGEKLTRGGVGLFYYAGHGVQVHGRNYLIPIHTNIKDEYEVAYEAVDAGRVLSKMEAAGNNMNIVILDACRNNPFARSFRSQNQGLAQMDAPKGSIIAYATAPGSISADGNGRNGIYTKYLLQYINKHNLKIEEVFKRVRAAVVNETSNRQVPWESSSLMGDFSFNSADGYEKINVKYTQNEASDEKEMWDIIKYSNSIDDFVSFLEYYPNGRFHRHAQIKLQQLKRKTTRQSSSSLIKQKQSVEREPTTGKLCLFPTHDAGTAINDALGTVLALKTPYYRVFIDGKMMAAFNVSSEGTEISLKPGSYSVKIVHYTPQFPLGLLSPVTRGSKLPVTVTAGVTERVNISRLSFHESIEPPEGYSR